MEFEKLITERYSVRNFKSVALLVMVYPAEASVPYEFHSKFRPMEEIVVYEEF